MIEGLKLMGWKRGLCVNERLMYDALLWVLGAPLLVGRDIVGVALSTL